VLIRMVLQLIGTILKIYWTLLILTKYSLYLKVFSREIICSWNEYLHEIPVSNFNFKACFYRNWNQMWSLNYWKPIIFFPTCGECVRRWLEFPATTYLGMHPQTKYLERNIMYSFWATCETFGTNLKVFIDRAPGTVKNVAGLLSET